ncbi:MAG: hypothetical protein N2572_05745 [Syntrophales bacterium]|nr:hypothetical protein [Syntrophales bacterium]
MVDINALMKEIEGEAYDSSDIPFDFLEEGVSTALVCEPEIEAKEKIIAALENMGYRITKAETAKEALKRCRFHTYHVVVVDEKFEAENPEENAILAYLAQLPMAIRREMFVCLISERFRTMDKMAAFHQSVNLVLNRKNLDDFATILKTALADEKAFYRVFRETKKRIERD